MILWKEKPIQWHGFAVSDSLRPSLVLIHRRGFWFWLRGDCQCLGLQRLGVFSSARQATVERVGNVTTTFGLAVIATR